MFSEVQILNPNPTDQLLQMQILCKFSSFYGESDEVFLGIHLMLL
jgi:hypothetical protein